MSQVLFFFHDTVAALQPTSKPVTSAPTSCEQRKFYYSAETGCSNQEEDVDPTRTVFETSEQCCIVEYPDPMVGCIVVDTCTTPSPTKKPTVAPTKRPTEAPTRVPSYNPTTLSPSASPSERTTFGATPTVGTGSTSAPVKARPGRKLRNMV